MNLFDVMVYVFVFSLTCLVLLTIVILLTTGFKKTGRNCGGLFCLTAPPSSGKSYVATHIALEFLRKGRKVFSNYPIVFNNGHEQLQTCALTKEMLLTKNLNGCVLIIDEAHNWFWSRKFKEFTEEYKSWFSTLAQHEISLYYIVQHENRVDTIINDSANLFGQISKLEIPILEMPVYFNVTWWNTELDMQFGRTNDKIEPYHNERIWFNKDTANSYDTKFFGYDKRPEYTGVPWIEWLKQKGIEYHGNYDFSLRARISNFIRHYVLYIWNPISDIMKKGYARCWSEIGSRFDRDKESPALEASGGVPSGASNESQQIDEQMTECPLEDGDEIDNDDKQID